MKGAYGAMLIALGIFVAIMGGYLLNAQTVTTCETDWQYVTDVSGAFQGDRSDMDVEYSPPSNITGWSYKRGYNDGWISGVSYTESARPTLYSAYSGSQATASYTISVTSQSTSGTSAGPDLAYNAEVSGTSHQGLPQAEGFGARNGEVLTLFRMDGHADVEGAFAAPLSDLVPLIPGARECASITITLSGTVSGYPCFASVSMSYGRGTPFTEGSSQATYYPIVAEARATASSTTATVYPLEQAVQIGDQRMSLADVFLVWGSASFEGWGPSVPSASMSVSATTASDVIFVNPAMGVLAIDGVYVTEQAVYTEHASSATCSLTVAFGHPDRLSESRSEGSVYVTSGGQQTLVASWEYQAAHTLTGANAFVFVTVPGSESRLEGSSDDGHITLAVSVSGSSASVSVNGGAAAAVTLEGTGASEIRVVSQPAGTWQASVEATAVSEDGNGQSRSGSGDWAFDMSWRTSQTQTTTHSYSSSWWCNGYDNSAVRVAFTANGTAFVYTELALYGPAGTSAAIVTRGASGTWLVEVDEVIAEVGKWPAIEVEFRPDGYTAYPLGSFTSFTDYTRIGAPVSRTLTVAGGGVITDMEVEGSAYMPMQVVSTTTRIAEGGLYLQDASLDVSTAFPDALAVSLVIGSAAHVGQSITISSGSASAQIQVDGDSALIGDKWVPLNGLAFRWISPDAPPSSAGGVAYPAAIYYKGKTYSAGAVWAEPRNGEMTLVLDGAAEAPTIALDGVWAPEVSMYDGHNRAAERTELADFTKGEYRWDKNDFVIVLMGTCVIGCLAGSYMRLATGADWLVTFGAVAILWLIL